MKRELSPDPSAVGGGGAAVPGSADPRAHVAKVPRLEDPGAAALDRPPGHDASASIARATRDEHPASPPRSVAPSVPAHPLSPTMTSAQMAARVMAAAAERAAGVAGDERAPERAAPAVDARAEPRQIAVAEETEIARPPEAVAATTAGEAPQETVAKPSPPPEAGAETLETPNDAGVGLGPEPPRPRDAPAPTETSRDEPSVLNTEPEPETVKRAASTSVARGARDATVSNGVTNAANIDRDSHHRDDTNDVVEAKDACDAMDVDRDGAFRHEDLARKTEATPENSTPFTGYPRDPHLRWRAIQTDPDPFVRNVLARLRNAESTEPYHQVGNEWRRAPWDTNPYESVGPGYVRAGDMPEADAALAESKLRTSLPDGWMDLPPDPPRPSVVVAPPDETPCLVCGRADDEASFVLCDSCPKGGHFRCLNMPRVPEGDWFCSDCGGAPTPTPRDVKRDDDATVHDKPPTARNNDNAPLPLLPSFVPNAKPLWENRVPLRLGVDVEERPMWGMDCYTRVAVDAALSQAPSFAGTDAAAVARREAFFAKRLMPAVHSLWKDGWDLKLAVRRVEEEARENDDDDLDAVVEACRYVTRAIEEVDEAGLDTHPPPRPPKGQRAFASGGSRASKKKSGATSASYVPPGVQIKRPLGAYMIYANEARPALLAQHPPEWARNISEIGKALGAGWKSLSAEEKAKYSEKAAALKKQFEEVDLPAAIKRAEEEEEARVEAEALKEKRAREAAAAAAAAVVAAREERLKKRADEAAATAAAREERLLKRRNETADGDGGGDFAEATTTTAAAALFPSAESPVGFPANVSNEAEAEEEVTDFSKEAKEDLVIEERYLPPNRRAAKRRHFRLHPKGVGVVCVKKEGIKAGTYVQDYLGELYTPWRWYERQDAIKKREPGKALPDFFNITLERPKDDDAGIDTLFVEAAHRCTFASRLSHSCAPNCQTVVLAHGGQLTIAQYTTRDIAFGEELSWNYSCVTESEKEYRAAICLCSSTRCKGAFLDYAGSSSFTAVMSTKHDFCDRNALLIRACAERVTDVDRTRLAAAGIKSAALSMAADVKVEQERSSERPSDDADRDDVTEDAKSTPSTPPPPSGSSECPEWLVKWAALTLEYIETEKVLLPDALMEKPLDGITYDRFFAEATAAGVFATRLTNLVVTLDKIKYVLRQPGQCRAPFLRPLSDAEIVDHLWLGSNGIFRRAVDAMNGSGSGSNALGAKGSEARNVLARLKALRDGGGVDGFSQSSPFADGVSPATPDEARAGLRLVSTMIRTCGNDHVALADCLLLYAETERWVTPAPYVGFTSPPVKLTPLPKDAEYDAEKAFRKTADAADKEDASREDTSEAFPTDVTRVLSETNGGHAQKHDDGNTETDVHEDASGEKKEDAIDRINPDPPRGKSLVKLAKRYRGDLENVMRKKYQQHFCWGQLVSWFKQTIYDPSASLSADRRGTMSLPDPESAYGSGSKPGSYGKNERKILLTHLEKNCDRSWPTTWRWSFRNPAKVYGSPFIDDAILVSRGEERRVPELVRRMREM